MTETELTELAKEIATCYRCIWKTEHKRRSCASKLGEIGFSGLFGGPIGMAVAIYDVIKSDDSLDEKTKKQYEDQINSSIAKIVLKAKSLYPCYNERDAFFYAFTEAKESLGGKRIYDILKDVKYGINDHGSNALISDACDKIEPLIVLYLDAKAFTEQNHQIHK